MAPRADLVSIDDYLAGELESPSKHEYVGGVVYAMAGARNLHNAIEGNAFAYLHGRVRKQSCRPYNSVLSRKTRRIDEGVPTLAVYLLVEHETALVIAYRRTDRGFVREVYAGLDAVIPLPEFAIELPLAEIYEGVEPVPEDEDE